MNTTTSIILDKRRMKKTNAYPLKLQVTSNRKTVHYSTIYDLSEADYEKLSVPRIGTELQKVKDRLKLLKREADEFLDNMQTFSFRLFEQYFVNHHAVLKQRKLKQAESIDEDDFDFKPYHKRFSILTEKNIPAKSIAAIYLVVIKNLIKEERIGTALAYKDSYSSIKTFKGNVLFEEVSVSLLNQYERWMLNKGRSRTTVGIKLRNLRAVFNEAISAGIVKKEKCYPFGKRKYQIPTGKNIKKALDQEAIREIYYYEPDSPALKKAKAFWLFCYFGNGMNPKDVVYLKWKDIEEDYFVFNRAKTVRTTRQDPRLVTVYINDEMQKVIEQYGTKDRHPDNYVFPIMDDKLSPLKQYERVPLFTRFINDGMKAICEELKIDKRVTTIVSRHTFSTQLKRSGVSIEYIQEALGHTDKRTTENYLDSFSRETKKEYASLLTTFK